MDQCIRHVVGVTISDGLTAHDIFYCYVSQAHIALQSLVSWSEIAAHSDRRPLEIATNLSTANEILLVIFYLLKLAVPFIGFIESTRNGS